MQINGAKVGYLAPGDAKMYRRVMRTLMREQTVGVGIASIRGGRRLDSGDEGRYEVVLRLAPPESALNDPTT